MSLLWLLSHCLFQVYQCGADRFIAKYKCILNTYLWSWFWHSWIWFCCCWRCCSCACVSVNVFTNGEKEQNEKKTLSKSIVIRSKFSSSEIQLDHIALHRRQIDGGRTVALYNRTLCTNKSQTYQRQKAMVIWFIQMKIENLLVCFNLNV